MILCQISDTHIKAGRKKAYGIVDTAGLLEDCVRHVLALPQRPDAVIVTGDLVDWGRPDEYALLRELLQPLFDALPVYLMPGNHDDRDNLRSCFPEHGYLRQWAPFVQYAIDDHPLRLVALDTLVPREGCGLLCESRLQWLEHTLAAAPTRPTVVALHHPPLPIGNRELDAIALADGCELLRLLAATPRWRGLVFGHVHQHWQGVAPGRAAEPLLGCTSTICPFGQVQPSPHGRAADPGGRLLELAPTGDIRHRLLRWSPAESL
jgi:3',5'-cyclic AMP phosphodiesterase CpdA